MFKKMWIFVQMISLVGVVALTACTKKEEVKPMEGAAAPTEQPKQEAAPAEAAPAEGASEAGHE